MKIDWNNVYHTFVRLVLVFYIMPFRITGTNTYVLDRKSTTLLSLMAKFFYCTSDCIPNLAVD